MKIKRFTAPDMRTALRMVREEHGADAVILSNRRTDEGVEIVAASNYDEGMVQQQLEAAARREAEFAAATAEKVAQEQRLMAEREAAHAARQQALAQARAESPRPQAPAGFDADALVAAAAAKARPQASTSGDFAKALLAAVSPRHAGDALRDAMSGLRAPAAAAATPSFAQLPDDAASFTPAALMAAAEPTPAPAVPAQAAMPHDGSQAPLPQAAAVPAPAAPHLSLVPTPEVPQSDAQLMQMRDELAQMRSMIEREMSRLTDERLRGSPVRGTAMELMEDYGFDAGITRDVVLQIPADTDPARGRGMMLGLISRRLPVCPIDPLEEGGVIALVGPTGAGKTTTIAKLAARYAAEHGARNVALVTTDVARIGGREQLHSYGRQLGVAVHEADSHASLITLLQRLSDYKLVLVDTAGLGQRDRALASQLNWLRAAKQVRTLLVLPANSHFSDLDEVVRRFQTAAPQGVVLTKLDETGRLGSALSVVVDHGLPLTWVTDGQQVPQDLHRANAASLALRLEDLRRAADKPNIPEHDHAVA
ncbi:flagellar biosynthesis protein FlhF [Pseudoxanthomonas composti]|uniref:Flagellar biosynthesis protein FlhF n=1 Tax=Pseudoxanthomonas composti TaxID=2137479 RepID=A0A4Q1JUI8_9GAMM|nr:flagellar biosynthesis protein FlhF [Pseudoxanthomonas composti]RXR02637.1 flagellar biosynthesis protein FlhF [Pseudoxanthomonas composti]